MPKGKLISHYQDSRAMTREILEWLKDAESHGCTSLSLEANCGLENEAGEALAKSVAAQTIQSLKFQEIYFSPELLKTLLAMPVLQELKIRGGESYDWNGPRYVWDTLSVEHLEVLMTDPHAQRLRVLEIVNQNFSESVGDRLRAALPNLQTLRVEEVEY